MEEFKEYKNEKTTCQKSYIQAVGHWTGFGQIFMCFISRFTETLNDDIFSSKWKNKIK